MKKIKVLISSSKIKSKVNKIAQQINKDFKNKQLVVVSVLSGSVVFCSDIIRKLSVTYSGAVYRKFPPHFLIFARYSPYTLLISVLFIR